MKPNLLETLTPKEQRKRLIWSIIVYSSAVLIIISIGSVQISQLYTLFGAKKAYDQEAAASEQFDQLTNQEKALKNEINQLKEVLDSVAAQQKAHQTFTFALQTITNTIPPASIKRLEFSDQKIKITFLAPSLEVIQTYIQQFEPQAWCDTLHVRSLEIDNDKKHYTLTFVIHLMRI